MKAIYAANDGTQFDDQQTCLDYENAVDSCSIELGHIDEKRSAFASDVFDAGATVDWLDGRDDEQYAELTEPFFITLLLHRNYLRDLFDRYDAHVAENQ